MSLTVWIAILMSLAIISAIIALESQNLMISVIGLIAMNVFVWGMFLFFHADLVAWIQLIVYGGGFTALFLVVLVLTENQKDEIFDLKKTIFAAVVSGIVVGILVGVFIVFDDVLPIIGNGTNSTSDTIAQLWINRPTDLIIQGLLFFATSLTIGALFLQQKKKKLEETKA